MTTLRDRMLCAPDEMDSQALPPRFADARDFVRGAIREAEKAGIAEITTLLVLLSETFPRLVHLHGPQGAAAILDRMAHAIASGETPAGALQ